MTARRAALKAVVDSVADGTSGVDWTGIESQLDDKRDQALLRQLWILAHISDVQRSETKAIDERALHRTAKEIARVLPIDLGARTARPAATAAPAQTQTIEIDQIAGERWSRFELLECIGQGAFGSVYRAFDTNLHREVAVKILHQHKLPERRLEEARALARVDHPNVVTVYDAEFWGDRVGICMEFIRGKTLEDLQATQGTHSAREAAAIGQDLCQALSAVHAAGLIHRDIKAQNVMREDGGRIVLMDFGAGKTVDEGPGPPSRLTGTPLYIAPEVLSGAEASVQSDIYSVGVLLYYLVTNEFPVYGRSYDELREAHRSGQVRRLRDAAPTVPSSFVRVLERALAPDPRDRYASAGELEQALSKAPRSRPYYSTAAVLTFALGAGAVAAWPLFRDSHVQPPLVVLLPLDAGLGVDSHMAHAVTDEIYQSLAMIDTLRVSSPPSAANAKAGGLSMQQITGRLKAAAVVAGTVSQAGAQLEVRLRLFPAGSDSPTWAQTYAATSTHLASVRRASALAIATQLDARVSSRIVRQLGRPPTASTEAYDAYARGLYLNATASRSDLRNARMEFERSIQADPSFAPAHAALAHVLLDIGVNGRRSEWPTYASLAKVTAHKALELDSQLAEAHAVLGEVAFRLDWKWPEAEEAFRHAITLSASQEFARLRYAHFLAARGRFDEALRQLEEARQLDPYSNTADLELVSILQYARRFSEAEALALSLRDRADNPRAIHTRLGRILAATGRYDDAIDEFEQLVDSASGDAYAQAEIASAHAAAGRIAEAQAILDKLHERSRVEEISPELFSLILARLGRFDDAFRYLDQAIQVKATRILWMKVDPRWDPLRSDPRFDAMLKRLGI